MDRPYLTIVACLAWLTLTLAFVLPCQAQVQGGSTAFPLRSGPNSNVRVTYGGSIIMDLGNYEVIFGPPLPLGSGPEELGPPEESGSVVSTSPQIIFKGDSGLRWDGRGYFYHPAYPYEITSRHYYRNRVVGRGEEQYPPPSQYERIIRRGRFALRGQPIAPGPRFGITPTPAPSPTQDLPAICRDYPYAVQCRPEWVQPSIAARPPSDLTARDSMEKPAEARPAKPAPTPSSQPPIEIPRPAPIIILCPGDSADPCVYELLSSRGNFAYTLTPGQKHVLEADRSWRIRFDSNGMGVKTYWLRSGKTYRFRKDQSDVWQLRWLRKATEGEGQRR